jgi:dihydrodipicolinate synthase/N-acetylneuraminate lyase
LGVRAVVVAGSTGEAAALTVDERGELLSAVQSTIKGTVPVIAGTGAPSARQAADLTARAHDGGADAVLVLSPPNTPDPLPYYTAVANAAGEMPVLAYHFPKVSSPGIAVDTIDTLPVSGCKDSSGDAERMLATLKATAIDLYTGSAVLLTLAGQVGCAGAILALANVEPEGCIAAFDGDAGVQRDLIDAHLNAKARFPSSLKAMVAKRFATSEVARAG